MLLVKVLGVIIPRGDARNGDNEELSCDRDMVESLMSGCGTSVVYQTKTQSGTPNTHIEITAQLIASWRPRTHLKQQKLAN